MIPVEELPGWLPPRSNRYRVLIVLREPYTLSGRTFPAGYLVGGTQSYRRTLRGARRDRDDYNSTAFRQWLHGGAPFTAVVQPKGE